MNFYSLDKLNLSNEAKNELRIAYLDGIDMSYFIKKGIKDEDKLREYRMWVQYDVPQRFWALQLELETLTAIRKVSKLANSEVILREYITQRGYLLIDEDNLRKILLLSIEHPEVVNFDFSRVQKDIVPMYLYGISKNLDVGFLLDMQISDKNMLDLLMSIMQRGYNISLYLQQEWSYEQMELLTSFKDETFVTRVSPEYTLGQLEEAYRGNLYGVFDIISQLDEDGIPLFNEYQMREVVEGARFGLDIMQYADYMVSDYEMASKRNALLNQLDDDSKRNFKVILSKRVN